ncbi:MAG: DUF5337 domain-containing protein [Rhodobacterales bacterium]|nr:DUF5337 domain-containing protein [Rhodobacterales bacterium]MDX5499513.1 DUF5337 domain-containing protein [Rhodobacterales bacterium]
MAVRPPTGPDAFARRMRVVGTVIALTTVLWLLLGEIGRQYHWDGRYALLIDLAALAAYVWALIVAWQLWRKRRDT